MGTVLSTLGGYSDDEYGESTIGVEAEQKAITPQQETVLPPAVVHCFLHPGELPVKEWRCKLKLKGRKKPAKGILHAFPSSLCFHPRSHSTPVTQFDLVGVSDISLGTKKSKPAVVLHTSIGRSYVGGLSHEELQDCHLVLSSLWTNIRARQPVPQPRPIVAVARAQPLQPQGSSEELKRLAAIGAREQEFGMRAHPALPDSMAALFLHAKQSSDGLRAHGLTPNAPDRLNKTDTILPVSLGSFWKAFASQRWQDWPNIFLPAGRWRTKVGEWEADGVGFSRRVWYSAKPPKSRPSGEPLSFENMASVQRACLVVNRKSLETRIHVAVVSTVNGNEYPKAKEWFELVDISRDKGFPILQVLDYRWREEAPSPLA